MWWTLACAPAADPLVRDQVELQLDGQTERWQLVWRAPPQLDCMEYDPSCPCEGFAVAERGELDLVRIRPRGEREILPLTPLFDGSAMLQRWSPSALLAEGHEEVFPEELLARQPRVPAFHLRDYDHDGRAAEFVLQVAAYGCGMREAVLVGLQKDGRLGVYRDGLGEPIVREPETWQGLLHGPVSRRLETPCGDHGSDIEIDATLRATPEGIVDGTLTRPCGL